tara:strand:- start:2294 stop:2692 length:399 start_codon:yes stop_codon:yes gene_type:complete
MKSKKLISNFKWKFLVWGFLIISFGLALTYGNEYGINQRIVILATLVLGIFTQVFSGITSLIALIPFFGPFILKVISIPIFYLLNAMGWVVSAVAIKKGYANELSKSRIITLALLVGIIIGYILGNIIPLNK